MLNLIQIKKMKKISLLLVILSFICVKTTSAQSLVTLNEDSIIFNISPDVQEGLRDLWPAPENVKWSRQVYREIFFNDSTRAIMSNSILKYPDEPVYNYVEENGVKKLTLKQNLFWLIFKLAMTHKVPVYESSDYLTFTEKDLITKDSTILKNLKYIQDKGNYEVSDKYTRSANSTIIGYMVKENYYFDAEVSELRSQIVAIAPLVESEVEAMNATKNSYSIPFWITYESIMPWLMTYTTMASEKNSSDVITFDTYFRRRLFKGNIIKIDNPLNQSIAIECKECCADNILECMKRKQGEVERQILEFDQKQLWVLPKAPVQKVKGKKVKAKATAATATKEQEKKN